MPADTTPDAPPRPVRRRTDRRVVPAAPSPWGAIRYEVEQLKREQGLTPAPRRPDVH